MSTILRQAAIAARQASRARAFSSTTVAREDIVKNIYLDALKNYKPPVVPKGAHVGVVKQFSLPPSPQPLTVPTDLASELAAYDTTEPTVASVSKSSANSGEDTGGADEFLAFLEADVQKPDHGHH